MRPPLPHEALGIGISVVTALALPVVTAAGLTIWLGGGAIVDAHQKLKECKEDE